MPAQRSTAADPSARRSAYPHMAGVPSFGAVLIAVAATVLGVAIEAGAGHRELGTAFAVCYVLGCVAAVLAVRQSAIFTAVIQPPLLLFVAVPLAYSLFHGEELSGLKGFLITCGYPLIERFPLMLFAAATVLVIGLARWYLPAPAGGPTDAGTAPQAPFGGLAARLFGRRDTRAGREGGEPPRHSARPARHSREDRERPRRDPAAQQRRRAASAQAPQERRRPRPDREPREGEAPRRAPRERRDPRDAREGYPPRPARAAGYEPRRGYQPRENYPPRRDYEPREYDPRAREPQGYDPRADQARRNQPPVPPRRPRPDPRPRRDAGDHHPVSRVRYRGSDPEGPPRRAN